MSLDSPRHETINLYVKQPENIPSTRAAYLKKKSTNTFNVKVYCKYVKYDFISSAIKI